MIEGFYSQHLGGTELLASLGTNDSATILGLAAVTGFGILSLTLLISSFRHKPDTKDFENPLAWPIARARPLHRPERVKNCGNLSSWKKIGRLRLPDGPKLN